MKSIAPRAPDQRVPLAVLGDSDSQGYHDRLWFRPEERGGPCRAATFQWTEVLARLRADQLDLGARGVWGTHRYLLRLQDALGIPSDRPKKEDHRYNFAMSGAQCRALVSAPYEQARRLVRLMDTEAGRWERGVVVVRIGGNDFGDAASLDMLAQDPNSRTVGDAMSACVDEYRAAVALIHARHPRTRLVVVGTSNNSHWPPNHGRWQSQADLQNIESGLEKFDGALRRMAESDPRLVFFDDRAWFTTHWGGRNARGQPNYRIATIGGRWAVSNTQGDAPTNAVLADGHAGTVWNTLWAQRLVGLLDQAFALGIAPISEEEVTGFLAPLMRAEHGRTR